MRLIVADDYAALSRAAADVLAATIAAEPTAAILAATGNTPMGAYEDLAARRRRGEIDASRLRVFQLDEYLGLPVDDPRSLFGWTRRSFVEPLGVPDTNVVRLPGDAADPAAACRAYEAAVAAGGGIDLAVLGLGPNGHLGFNEPPAAADAPTRVVDLTPESIVSNGAYWGGSDRVPRRALTAGMTVVLASRRVLLLVSGEHKREILRRTLEGPVTPAVPASYLRRAADVTVITDRAAVGSSAPNPPGEAAVAE
ncbi:MAG: Glucosamine-6-phosphate deaminase [uncultured Thermomicrobiales bacterium]|uniref:Glucosamine-6-phosphate deaminase n=1 Tax=uncultured Thermomicrobiales bacterium TaxID=1645740 RepID=A0A6J4U153_9BACT|nr:MAG: Glucosamine-6-phosphate deaminase [uncultured Thermomicrobiales bacterium]